MKTRYFKSCWGVFEGGGVCGAALAGAYKAATTTGIRFERVAGTSAGSIVASLVAAKADPDFVIRKLKATKFKDFLVPPTKQDRVFESGLGLACSK